MLGVPLKSAIIAYNGYTAGLGNRIRVVLGSASLATSEHRSFYYVWPTGSKFGPEFTDLWDFSVGRTVSRATSRLLARRWDYVDERVPDWLTQDKRAERLWQIRTGSDVVLPRGAAPWPDLFRRLQPVPRLATRIRAEFDQYLVGRPYVGVMVRTHAVSHPKTIASSPVSWFIERMLEIRRTDADVRFFLSCDTSDAQSYITSRVGNCYGLTDKGGYNTIAGVSSAVCDLYLLASAGHVLGPHFSSFVELAQHLSGGVLPLETPETGGIAGTIDLRHVGVVEDVLRPSIRTAPGG